MAALSVTAPTLLDMAKSLDPDGTIADVVEILAETNEVLTDMAWLEANGIISHRTTIRSGLPTPTWRRLNYGVQPTKGTKVQVTDNIGMLEDYAEVDKALADLHGNAAAFRLQEDRAHIEGISQEIADTIFYGNEGTEPEAFTGLAPRFNSLSAANAENIIVGGGSDTDNASIWLVVWGANTVHGIVPKGSKAGMQMKDLGEVTLETTNGVAGARSQAYRTHYRFDAGLSVRDWRYVVRIPNIDKSLLKADISTGADLSNLMFQALRRPPSLKVGRAAFYMARDIETMLFQQTSHKTASSTLKSENVGGEILTSFHGVPLRRCDCLAANEALVS